MGLQSPDFHEFQESKASHTTKKLQESGDAAGSLARELNVLMTNPRSECCWNQKKVVWASPEVQEIRSKLMVNEQKVEKAKHPRFQKNLKFRPDMYLNVDKTIHYLQSGYFHASGILETILVMASRRMPMSL